MRRTRLWLKICWKAERHFATPNYRWFWRHLKMCISWTSLNFWWLCSCCSFLMVMSQQENKQQLFTLQHLSLFSYPGLLFSVFISLITSQQEGTNTGKHLNNQKSQNRKHKNPTVVILRLNLKTWLQQKVSEVSNELEKHNKCLKLTLYQDRTLLLYSNFSHTSRLAHTLCTQQQWALQYCNYASMQHKDKAIGTSIFSHHCSSNNNNSDMWECVHPVVLLVSPFLRDWGV